MKTKMWLFILFAFQYLWLFQKTFSQSNFANNNINFKKLTHQEGFVVRNIYCVIQDCKGFLWMAGPDRLIRFDGKRQKLFRYSSADNKSIGANTVRAICEDKAGVIWFGTTSGGLNKYNASEENFIRYLHNPVDSSSISSNDVSSIFQDSRGILWIGTSGGGLNKFDTNSEKFIHFKNKPDDINSISDNNITIVFQDSRNNFWIGTSKGGLNKFDPVSQKFTRFQYIEIDPSSLSNDNVTGICEDVYGNLWISTLGGGLNKCLFNKKNNKTVFINFKNNPQNPKSLSSNSISALYRDRENIIWVGTWGEGLNKLLHNPTNNNVTFFRYKHDDLNIFSLNDNNVNCIYEDNSRMLWISTGGGGLHIVDKKEKQFKLFANVPNNPNSLSSTAVSAVFEDREENRWIGMRDGGLNKMDKRNNRITRYMNNPQNPYSINDNHVLSIYEDKFGELWIGTWNGGLNKFDKAQNRFYSYKHNPMNIKSISDNRIQSIIEDSFDNLWIGTNSGGLNKFNRKEVSFTHYRHDPNDSNSICSDYISKLYCEQNGSLLIATKDGLDAFDSENEKFIHFNLKPKNSSLNKNIRVTSLRQSKNGILWIGTYDQGLLKYDIQKGIIKSYTSKEGLPIDYITGILEDNRSILWISTTIGVTKFDPMHETMRTYIYEDGIQGIGEMTPFKCKNGELMFGGVMGLSVFHPESIRDYTHLPPVYFTDLYLFNKKVPIGYDTVSERKIIQKSLVVSDEIVLNYDNNVITIDFAIIDFHSLFKWNQFSYMLQGFDKDWTNIAPFLNRSALNLRSVTYTNLNPGEYVLKVKAANSDDIWNETGASIKLIITPPWWKTFWAYALYVLFFNLTIISFFRILLLRQKSKQKLALEKEHFKKIEEVERMKTNFFTNISHEFRTPLTLILGPAKHILDKTKDDDIKEEASLIYRSAKKLNRLTNQLLEISRIESGKLNLITSLQNLIPALLENISLFKSFAESKNISLNYSNEVHEINVYLDRDKFDKIIGNVLSNALKFTPEGGFINIQVKQKTIPITKFSKFETDIQFVEISISDTGIGIPKEKLNKIFDRFYQVDNKLSREYEGTGIGLSLTKELIEIHKGIITVESEEGKGSNFKIYFPLGKNHLLPSEIIEKSDFANEIEDSDQTTLDGKTSVKNKYDQKLEKAFTNNFDEKPNLLIIEDNADMRNFIKKNLHNHFKIYEAVDGIDGWEKAEKNVPDLIISDVMMPKMDGFKLCEKLKTDEKTSHIPIILLTAKASCEDKIEGFELGADEYIMKPFKQDELKVRIINLLEQRKRLHEHYKKQGLFEIDDQKIASVDQKFILKAVDIVNKNISNSSFSVEKFANNMNVSRSLLNKKLTSLIGESPSDFIRKVRLNKASNLIKNKSANITEIAFEVGFNDSSYFAFCFKEQFGVSPKQFQKQNH